MFRFPHPDMFGGLESLASDDSFIRVCCNSGSCKSKLTQMKRQKKGLKVDYSCKTAKKQKGWSSSSSTSNDEIKKALAADRAQSRRPGGNMLYSIWQKKWPLYLNWFWMRSSWRGRFRLDEVIVRGSKTQWRQLERRGSRTSNRSFLGAHTWKGRKGDQRIKRKMM